MTLRKQRLQAWRAYYEYSARIMGVLECRTRARSGLSSGEYNILLVLYEAQEPLRMGAIGQQVAFAPSRLTYAVSGLESRGLVERQIDPNDRRAAAVHLTEAGRQLFREVAAPHLEDICNLVMDELDEDEVAAMEAIFTKLARRLEKSTRRTEDG